MKHNLLNTIGIVCIQYLSSKLVKVYRRLNQLYYYCYLFRLLNYSCVGDVSLQVYARAKVRKLVNR